MAKYLFGVPISSVTSTRIQLRRLLQVRHREKHESSSFIHLRIFAGYLGFHYFDLTDPGWQFLSGFSRATPCPNPDFNPNADSATYANADFDKAETDGMGCMGVGTARDRL